MRLPSKRDKYYYKGVEEVNVYEQMLKAGLRFLLSTLHCHLLQYLGLVVTQISLDAWRVFLGAEEFFHRYLPSEITQSKGMYSFMPRSPLLRLVCDTPDSNRNWKGRYFFLQGDEWMCHPSEQEYMLVDKT